MDKVLTQEEIDALLRGMSTGQVETTAGEQKEPGVVSFDFTNQDRIIRGRMPTLEIINDNFCRLLRNSLSVSLRKVVDAGPRGVQMVKFGEFLRTLPVPSSLHIFRMEPLRGHAMLVLDPKLIFTLVDIFLGGSGKATYKVEGREFTAIESKIIGKVVNTALAELEKAWNTIIPVSLRYIRSEMNPQLVGIVTATDLVIVISFSCEIEQFTGMINLCIPYSMVEPIKARLYSAFQSDQLDVDQSWMRRLLDRVKTAEVEVVVELGRRSIMVDELLKLKVGDVLNLEKEVSDLLTAKVQGVPKLLGKAGVMGGSKAFQVEGRIGDS